MRTASKARKHTLAAIVTAQKLVTVPEAYHLLNRIVYGNPLPEGLAEPEEVLQALAELLKFPDPSGAEDT